MINLHRFLVTLFLPLLLASILAPPQMATAAEHFQRSVERYSVPDVELVNQDGEKVQLKSFLETDQPVIVDFIYGTCTTICPVLSAGFVNLQRKLAKEGRTVRLVSITIDPENDTPHVMKEYLKRYRAKPGWDFLTGSRADIDTVMTAFDAYIPDKMSHFPLNMIRQPKTGRWIRLFGMMSSRDFLAEYKKVADQ
ncbi:MAG TPA: SCO family protein [Geothermobacteraceae bacterium]|nr:SCO family protein [Geothermobacteraceae bacterium]